MALGYYIMSKKSDSKPATNVSTTHKIVGSKKNDVQKRTANKNIVKNNLNVDKNIKSNLNKNENDALAESQDSVFSVEYKEKATEFSLNTKISKLKNLDEYFSIKQNKWLLQKHIARYGVCDEDTPENSLKAYENAIKENYAILISVQMLKDGNIVCYKDKTLGKLSKDGYITNLNFDEVKDLHILNSIYTPPTLIEALDKIANRTEIIIEIFNEGIVGKMEENILKILEPYCKKYNCYNNVAVMSMNPYSINWFYNVAPWFTRIIKSCGFKATKVYANIKTSKLKKLKFIKMCHSDFTCYNAKDLPNKYVKKGKPIGVIAYNVSSQEQYNNILKYADNVIFSGFTPTI